MRSHLLIAFAVLLLAPVSALAQSGCNVGAGTPLFNSTARIIVGEGDRGPACTSTARLRVKLKRDVRFWFDKTLTETTQSVKNGQINLRYSCHGAGGQTVYIEADDGNQKRQSRRVGVAFCG